MQRFDGKVVIVTGAASGIGEATARRFAAEGAKVALVDREEDALRNVAAALPDDRSFACVADVADSQAVDAMVARAAGPRSRKGAQRGLCKSEDRGRKRTFPTPAARLCALASRWRMAKRQ